MSLVFASLDGGLRICVRASAPEVHDKAVEWASFLKAPLNPENPEQYFFHFFVEPEGVFVRDQEKRLLEIDFDKNHLDYERKGHRGKNELIAKALGVAKGARRVLDLSVGMGIDSVFLTQLGFTVIGVERSPVLYALLKEAFARTQKDYLKSYELHFADGLQFLKQNKGLLEVDAIYFDPMYPHKKKSALPKQEMVVFRDLVGHDDDASLVLQEALTWPVKRVVVKRPMQAEELLPGVRHSYEGKVVRYDTYVVG
ncbi:class I SAM-dependent methyltransferase [Bdellovibrio bacteriovorus]|uniref:class I SAM-dependent methyltransferase n=1 Tax=Bdellovibrio bacteriovorus TaxID=959 RepID=UPI0035A6BF98